jgi:hypothetical protein
MSEDTPLGGSTAAGVAGGTSGTGVAGGTAAAMVNGGASAYGRLVRGVLPEHGHVSPSTGGEIDYLRSQWGSDHLAGENPHPQYPQAADVAAQIDAALDELQAESDPFPLYQKEAEAGQPSGYAPLDAAGLVPTTHLPPLAITETHVVASEAAMLALPADVGDMAIRTDQGRTYVLAAAPATTPGNWVEMLAAGQVTSVNGETGVVSLSAADVGALDEATADTLYAALDHTHPNTVVGDWYFAASTNIAVDPGNGNARCDTGVPSTATVLSASRTNNDGYQQAVFLALDTGDLLYVQDKNDNTRWVRYTVSAIPTRNATYSLLPVTLVAASGVEIAPPQLCTVIFTVGAGGGGGSGGGAVSSVNGETGDVVLSADDVGALDAADLAAHAALPNAHHNQDHNHTGADGSGALTDEEHDGYSQYTNLGADPATPASNRIRLYAKDNGSGVATLYYRTENGTVYELPTLTTGGGGGSGAPANASYVTLAAENKLSQETALGAGVVMSGTLAARPAFGTAGRLYHATDAGLVYRDSGSAWAAFAVAPTLADAKGDLFAASGADALERLAVGTDGHVLTADSTQALGVRWAAAGAGGTGVWVAPAGTSPKLTVQETAPGGPATGDLWVW